MSAVGFQSDSQVLVDTCLARLRVDARLDDEPVLPTIDALPEDDDVMEVGTGDIVIDCADVREIPSAASIVRETAAANARSRRETPTHRKVRATAAASRVVRWPVVLCALVATYFGIGAFMRSPLGAKPEVQHVVKVSRAHVATAIHVVAQEVRETRARLDL